MKGELQKAWQMSQLGMDDVDSEDRVPALRGYLASQSIGGHTWLEPWTAL